jgi:hypothetical protein
VQQWRRLSASSIHRLHNRLLTPISILSSHLILGILSGSFQFFPLKLFMHLFWNKFVRFGFHELPHIIIIIKPRQTGFLGRGMSRRKDDTYTGQHKHRLKADIRVSSGFRTHDPNVWAGKDISCLRSRGHCDRPSNYLSTLAASTRTTKHWMAGWSVNNEMGRIYNELVRPNLKE